MSYEINEVETMHEVVQQKKHEKQTQIILTNTSRVANQNEEQLEITATEQTTSDFEPQKQQQPQTNAPEWFTASDQNSYCSIQLQSHHNRTRLDWVSKDYISSMKRFLNCFKIITLSRYRSYELAPCDEHPIDHQFINTNIHHDHYATNNEVIFFLHFSGTILIL